MSDKRITQQDVAKLAGVSRAAVSMAFKGDPGIPAETRERIRDIAAQIGYVPDPMLSALAAYRNRLRPSSFHGTLAWVVNSRGKFDWRKFPYFVDYFEGAQVAARRHGFQLEVFDQAKRGMTSAKLAAIFRARNIAGILLCPQPEAGTKILDFPWQDFVAVTFGYTLKTPMLHTVASSHFNSAIECFNRLRARGYKRIGFVLSQQHIERTKLHYLGGYLSAQTMSGMPEQLPPMIMQADAEPLRAWLDTYKPDAIVGGSYLPRFLKTLGYTLPGDLGVACPGLSSGTSELSGVWENSRHMGAVATDFLVSLLTHGERGVPAVQQTVLVEGVWIEGLTMESARRTK